MSNLDPKALVIQLKISSSGKSGKKGINYVFFTHLPRCVLLLVEAQGSFLAPALVPKQIPTIQ